MADATVVPSRYYRPVGDWMLAGEQRGIQRVGGVGDGCVLFFFQAEDGIRDLTVTGVQTCALPISCPFDTSTSQWSNFNRKAERLSNYFPACARLKGYETRKCCSCHHAHRPRICKQIGRASCRERV